jgi:hypothetical protein
MRTILLADWVEKLDEVALEENCAMCLCIHACDFISLLVLCRLVLRRKQKEVLKKSKENFIMPIKN